MLELVVEEGSNRGARLALHPGTSIVGRDVSCAIVLIDERASRQHARLEVGADGSVTIADLGSRNGTRLNGLPVDETPALVHHGDRLELAGTRLVLVDAETEPAELGVKTTIAGRQSLAAAVKLEPAIADRALELIASIGASLATARDLREGLASALDATLAAAGGARAALALARGKPRLVVAGRSGAPALGLELLGSRQPEAIEWEAGGRRGVSLVVPWRQESSLWLVVEEGATSARRSTWAAVASVLAPHVASLEDAAALRSEAIEARRQFDAELVAESPSMKRVLAEAARFAVSSSSVLITGESGTGKELLARALHAASPRRRRRFVAVNAAALPETLFESELFGHERAAFTGAVARRKGVFELADGGTLFLDEIGELSPATQPKLLRALETREVRLLGGDTPVKCDVRVVAATNKDLRALARSGRFREDLFFRLATVELRVPPLRERPADVEPLARHLLARITNGRRVELEPAALDALRAHAFPGNVRELRNVLERAVLLGDGRTIRAGDLPRDLGAGGVRAQESFPTLAEAERDHVEAALRRTKWNRSRAAKLLGNDRKTLWAKVKALGLRADALAPDEPEDDEVAS